jgi:CP family cyanate transporter-like MFS transporter
LQFDLMPHAKILPDADDSATRLLTMLCLLWLTGVGMRITVTAVAPIIPLIHDDLHMSETQVGVLIGIPLCTWALCAVPGSLFIARVGPALTLFIGLMFVALAGAARGLAWSIWLLYAASLLMGFGVAIMQPALPTLVRAWLPQRIGLATAVSTNGVLVGVSAGPILTIPLVLPLLAQSWRLDLALWSVPVLLAAALLLWLGPRKPSSEAVAVSATARWWPDWKNPLIWLLGLTFGSNNALFYGTQAFLPDYLSSIGRPDLIGAALGCMSGSQFVASTLLLFTADRLNRRVWPYAVFGPGPLLGVVGIVLGDGWWIVVAATVVGFSLAITFVITLALPAVLSPPGDVHRISAGMFTVAFALAVIVPILCGALWDLTGRPWTAFVLLMLCPITLTWLGVALVRHRPA